MNNVSTPELPELTPYIGNAADNILRIALDIGEGLLTNGADVHRVEIAIEKITRAYGVAHVDVFTIHSLILVAIYMPDGTYSTQSRRIIDTSNNITKLEMYNALSRKISETTPEISVVDEKIREIKKERVYPFYLTAIAYFLAAASFAIFFGGCLLDGMASGCIGIVMSLFEKVHIEHVNKMVKTALVSFVAGTLSCLFVRMGFGDNLDMIIIGTIMLLIPGLSFGSAMRDLLSGDTLTGTIKVVQAVITAVMMALGFALALLLVGSGLNTTGNALMPEFLAIIVRLMMAILGTVSFAMIYRVGRKRMLWAVLGGLFTYTVYELVMQLNSDVLIASLLAAMFMTLYSEALARIIHAPAVTFLLPSAIPIMPGGALYRTVYNLLFYNEEKFFLYGKTAVSVALGMAVGMGVASIIVGLILHLKKPIQNK